MGCDCHRSIRVPAAVQPRVHFPWEPLGLPCSWVWAGLLLAESLLLLHLGK